ncbi:hypothetical protein BVG19_g2301 [[Candida] boidinii]|nr:hypothetical protein BVG19_g2301 [[Candida] boidinii]OWB48883.1 hypothetical protein B5S27_g420 [[Candida] boidinii]OWB82179.1 hypothetical protein B5S33_g801 [[Candida] boidinii]
MSWTGFKKAFNRAGAQVIMKTNKTAEGSTDLEFDLQEKNFNRFSKLTNDINTLLSYVIENYTNLIEIQLNMAKTIDSYYGDFSLQMGVDKKLEPSGGGVGTGSTNSVHSDYESVSGISNGNGNGVVHKPINNRDGISLEYLKIVNEIKEEVLPQILEPFQITVLDPMSDIKNYNEEIDKLIKKRGRKKIDYDLINFKLKKLQNEKEQLEFDIQQLVTINTNSEELGKKQLLLNKNKEKLSKLLVQFTEIESIYFDINSKLKIEIDKFISLRLSIIDPSFEGYIKIQLKLFNDCFEKFEKLINNNLIKDYSYSIKIDALSREEYKNGKIDESLDNILLKMKSLDINNI